MYVYQEYPRDLVDKDGKVIREFKTKDSVPPGWFVRDTGEEVNPRPVLTGSKEAVAVKVAPPKVEG